MPDPNSIEEITQKEARAKAEAALLRAQADLIKAQGELAAANKSPDQTVITSTAEKERLDAQKGALEARKALHNMQKQADLEATQSARAGRCGLAYTRADRFGLCWDFRFALPVWTRVLCCNTEDEASIGDVVEHCYVLGDA